MKYSILIPVYNVESYLDECLQSVLAQTLRDYEVIIVDDGSTDGSGRICDAYAEKHDNIRVYHQKNEGLLRTRKFSYEKARGEWYVIVDSDDTIEPDALETIDRYTDRADCVIYGYRSVLNGKTIYTEQDDAVSTLHGKTEICRRMFIHGNYTALWRKAMRANLLTDLDYANRINVMRGEDLLLTLDSVKACGAVTFIPDVLYSYRINPDSIMHTVKYENYSVDAVTPLVLEFLRKESGFTEADYDEYRDVCLDGFLKANLSIISGFDTSLRNRRRLLARIRKSPYYRDFLRRGYSKRYRNRKNRIMFRLFDMKFDYLLIKGFGIIAGRRKI